MHSVLIVDNEPIIRKGLVNLVDWQALGCQVAGAAENGQQALDMLHRHPVDILITDIRMPGMDGLELTRQVRKTCPDTKIILVTAYSDFEYAQEALRQQVVDFIIKPTSKEKMSAAIHRAKQRLNSDVRQEKLKQVLQEKHQDNLGLQRKLFVEGLLSGNRLSLLYVRTQAARLGLQLKGAHLLCCRVIPPRDTDETGMVLALEEAMEYLKTALPGDDLLLLTAQADEYFALYTGEDPQRLWAALAEYIALAESMAEFNVQIGVSSPLKEALELHQADQQAKEALFYLSYTDRPAHLAYEQIPQVTEEAARALREILQKTKEGFRRQDILPVKEAMEDLENTVKARRIPLAEVRRCMSMLYNICLNTLMDYNLLNENILPRPEQFLKETLADSLSQPLLDLAQQIFLLIKGDDRSQEGSVRYIEHYIRNNLEKDLSLEHLASLVHLSPSYLSREFKRLSGENISAYITAERMAKARELLVEGSLKNYEIARLVGYEDPVYFSRAFKKTTGLRPSEFRQKENS